MSIFDLLIQLMSTVGLVAIVSSLWFKRRRSIIAMQVVGSFSFGVHFLLLGAFTAAAVNAVAVVRNLLFAKYNFAQRPVWPLLLVLATALALTILLWGGTIGSLGQFLELSTS